MNSGDSLPRGQSQRRAWPGGTATVTVSGHFPAAGGVSTVAELCHQGIKPTDGSMDTAHVLRRFTEPGQHDVNMPPGEYWTHSSGPDGADWAVNFEFSEPDANRPTPEKEPTLEERVRRLERGAP